MFEEKRRLRQSENYSFNTDSIFLELLMFSCVLEHLMGKTAPAAELDDICYVNDRHFKIILILCRSFLISFEKGRRRRLFHVRFHIFQITLTTFI